MQKFNFFPTGIFIDRIVLNNDKLLNSILKVREMDPKGIVKSNMNNSYHSKDNLQTLPEFREISEAILNKTKIIFEQEKIKTRFFLGNLWANINSKGGFNDLHTHGNCFFSGVYYVKTPENCGELRFVDPRPQSILVTPNRIEDDNKDNWHRVSFKGEPGQIVIFPYYLPHQVLPNQNEDIRVSLSFNIILDWSI